MRKFGETIVKLRLPILIISFLLLIPSFFGYASTRVNYDVLTYLPEDIETMQGQDILLQDFGKGAYAIVVCEGMEDKDVNALMDKIAQVDHVDSVVSYSALSDVLPPELLPDELQDVFYAQDGSASLQFLFFDTSTSADETMDAIDEIRSMAGEQCLLSSMSAIVTDTRNLVNDELATYVLIAVVLCALVLTLAMDSFLLPVLFLLDIGMAIIYNLGTNFIQGEISFVTMALVAVLQLGVTMDYSIFLYNAYKEWKAACPGDNKEAMTRAIMATIDSVTGSSLTTIAGFIALCFMSFTLGLDLGIVMAKGVLLGVICCITVLPSLILTFDKAIVKTSHKSLHLNLDGFSRFITKHYRLFVVLMLVLWIPAIYGNNRVNVYYKLDNSLPAYLGSVQANEALEEHFDMSSISMVLVSDDLSSKETRAMCDKLEQVDGINFVLGLDSITGSSIPEALVPEDVQSLLSSGGWKLLLLSSQYQVATDEANAQCTQLNDVIKAYDESAMLIGEAPCTKDLIEITDHDFTVVSAVSIGAIFILILLVLRSGLLPILLVLAIELAIYLNMSFAYYTGTTLPFIASVCIGTIQLGSTVDYAILMTTRYKHERLGGVSREESVQTAIRTSVHSVVTSAVGMFAATFGVGLYSDVDLIGSLCVLLARGALISMVVVIFIVPSLLMFFDKAICKTTWGMGRLTKQN
jgi:hypothetical protein